MFSNEKRIKCKQSDLIIFLLCWSITLVSVVVEYYTGFFLSSIKHKILENLTIPTNIKTHSDNTKAKQHISYIPLNVNSFKLSDSYIYTNTTTTNNIDDNINIDINITASITNLIDKIVISKNDENYRFGDVFYVKGYIERRIESWFNIMVGSFMYKCQNITNNMTFNFINNNCYKDTILYNYYQTIISRYEKKHNLTNFLYNLQQLESNPIAHELFYQEKGFIEFINDKKYLDIVLLYQCVNEFIDINGLNDKMPKENELVVHVRAGDKLKLHHEYTLGQILTLIRQSLNKFRLKNKAKNEMGIDTKKIDTITIVTSISFGGAILWNFNQDVLIENKKYFYDIFYALYKEFFIDIKKRTKYHALYMNTIDFDNLEIQLVSNQLPDIDMAYLSHAYHLIITEGGFSTVSACLNTNIVYNNNCLPNLRIKYNLQQVADKQETIFEDITNGTSQHSATTVTTTGNTIKKLKFRYIFIMGLEGTGHHFLAKIFDQFRDNKNKDNMLSKYFVNRPQSDKSLDLCSIGSSFAQGFTLKNRDSKSLYNSLIQDIRYAIKNQQNYDLNQSLLIAPKLNPSYSFCSSKKKYQAPNIIEIFLLLKTIENEMNSNNNDIQISFDMSILVSYRTFINSIYSACLRFGDCNERINRYYNISLPMMMKQMYFFIENIYNNNHNDDSYISKLDLSNYNDYSENDFYEKNFNDVIEKKYLQSNFVSKTKDDNDNDNNFAIGSDIKILYYDKIFEYNNLDNFTLMATNLANLFGIQRTHDNILKIANIFFNQVNSIELAAQKQSSISVKRNEKLATGQNMSVKWNTLSQYQSMDYLIQEFYSTDENDKQTVLQQTRTFESKLWTLFYIPQLAIN